LSIASTFIIASLDEFHQRFVPGRVGSFRDVLIDTGGALFLSIVLWAVRARARKQALNE
jgi:VanZ family protein